MAKTLVLAILTAIGLKNAILSSSHSVLQFQVEIFRGTHQNLYAAFVGRDLRGSCTLRFMRGRIPERNPTSVRSVLRDSHRKLISRLTLGPCICRCSSPTQSAVELQPLEHLWNHEDMFETGVVWANEC